MLQNNGNNSRGPKLLSCIVQQALFFAYIGSSAFGCRTFYCYTSFSTSLCFSSLFSSRLARGSPLLTTSTNLWSLFLSTLLSPYMLLPRLPRLRWWGLKDWGGKNPAPLNLHQQEQLKFSSPSKPSSQLFPSAPKPRNGWSPFCSSTTERHTYKIVEVWIFVPQ